MKLCKIGNFTGTTSAQPELNLPMSVAGKKSGSGSLFCAFLCFLTKRKKYLCESLQTKKKALLYNDSALCANPRVVKQGKFQVVHPVRQDKIAQGYQVALTGELIETKPLN